MANKWSTRRKVGVSLLAVFVIAGFVLYLNFNRLLSQALLTSFNSNIISDVYELKFEKLRVDIFNGDVRVSDVVIQPRTEPLNDYPYINSTLSLKADHIRLIDMEIWDLLNSGALVLAEISISKPDIYFIMSERHPNLFPFSDTTKSEPGKVKKKPLQSFSLSQFRLEDATIHVSNKVREAVTDVKKFNILLQGLLINQEPGKNTVSLNHIDISIDDVKRSNMTGPFRRSSLTDFKIGMDSARIIGRVDTVVYRASDVSTSFNNLDLQTVDSVFHLTVGAFRSSYKENFVSISNLSFTPNISKEALQARSKYQKAEISGTVGNLEIRRIDFDSLIYHGSLFVDSITIDNPVLSVFKDKLKPLDTSRVPQYFGQQIGAMKMPMRIKSVVVRNAQIVNEERKLDSSYAKIIIDRGNVQVSNVTSLSKSAPLVISADAYLASRVRFGLQLDFSYRKPEFGFSGSIGKFDMAELNPVLIAYTPATITAGSAEGLTFSGTAGWTNATGTMKFLYHDLEVDLALKDQAKWKSSLVAFAANSIVNTSNPGSAELPPRVVTMRAERDMNKGFVNIILKSILNGIKETLIMSKENRKAYEQAKKKAKG